MAVIVGGLASLAPASAGHGDVSLPGSDFEIDTDANLKVDHDPPSDDWANVNEVRKPDAPSGTDDDSFGQGTKEDTPVPTVVSGSIPPNKSDLLNFGVYFEETAGGDQFLNVFWHRVQEPKGTTNMDFEFNQSEELSTNGVTPVRTSDDILIQYDLAQGGTNPLLFLSRWIDGSEGATAADCESSNSLPCWSARENLSAVGDATGSINTSAIPAAEADGLGDISSRTFGEAAVDFDAIVGDTTECVGFGSAYLKSRASDSFPAALKDFIAPEGVNINFCGDVKVTKTDDATPPNLLDGAEFDLVRDDPPTAPDGQLAPGPEDTVVVDSCTTAGGMCTFEDIFQGTYWVIETLAPPGHDPADPAFQAVTVTASETVEVTFVNPRQRGAVEITKTRKHAAGGPGAQPHPGVEFTITGGGIDPVVVTTDANGVACTDGLLFGDYTVTETVPAGYVADDPPGAEQTVAVSAASTCGDGNEAEVSFGNTPLTDVTVSVDSQVDGGTASTIECVDGATPPNSVASGSTGADGDGSATASDLVPGTYTCTIVVDP